MPKALALPIVMRRRGAAVTGWQGQKQDQLSCQHCQRVVLPMQPSEQSAGRITGDGVKVAIKDGAPTFINKMTGGQDAKLVPELACYDQGLLEGWIARSP